MSKPLNGRATMMAPGGFSMVRLRLLTVFAGLLCVACTALGPRTVPRDRFDYNTAISDSWKEQTLLNIVKLRYADMPLFVEVASVVSGYTLEGSVNLGGTVSSSSAVQGNFFNLGTSGKYTDRPTITYAPITGSQFNRSFMTPIPPRAILFLMQSGWPVDLILPVTVDSINGLRSQVSAGVTTRAGDSGFYRVIELLRDIQMSGAISMQILKQGEEQETTVLFFHGKNLAPETAAKIKEVNELLGLRPDARQIQVTYALLPENDTQLAMITRSMLQIMIDLAKQVDVPPEHVVEGRTVPSLIPAEGRRAALSQVINIHQSAEQAGKCLHDREVQGPVVLDRRPRFQVQTYVCVPDDSVLVDRNRRQGRSARWSPSRPAEKTATQRNPSECEPFGTSPSER